MKTLLAFFLLCSFAVLAVDSSVPDPATTNPPPVKIRFQFKPILPK